MPPRVKKLLTFIFPCALAVHLSSCGDKDGPNTSSKNENKTPVMFRWDFSTAGRVYEYHYVQSMAAPGSIGDSRVEVKGTLAIRSEEDGTADVELMDVTVSSGERQQKMPNSSFSGLKNDGTAPISHGSQDAMIRMLLPVPPIALIPGESATSEIQFPARSNESVGYGPVSVTMTLDNIENADEDGIANFSVNFVSGKAVATSGADFPDDFQLQINGSGKMRFSIQQGRHLGGDLTVNIGTPSFPGQEPVTMSTEISLTPKSKE
jgi:hypothetical protein